MKSTLVRAICHVLAVTMMLLPLQTVQAGMIGTNKAATVMAGSADRATLIAFVDRAEVASQMQALGLDPKTAKERIAAMSDEEVHSLADRVGSDPAGGKHHSGAWLVVIIVVAAVIWWNWGRTTR